MMDPVELREAGMANPAFLDTEVYEMNGKNNNDSDSYMKQTKSVEKGNR